jgi:hypothetical protein
MKLGIMQPYFFPYPGYFQLISITDQWIVFDIVQYIRHGWINRNRILKPGDGWQYIIAPVKAQSHELLIKDAVVDTNQNWKDKVIAQLAHYKKAPFYSSTIAIVKECLFGTDSIFIRDINVHILETICKYLDIQFNYQICSDMTLDFDKVKGPGDWALQISHQMNATEYINPPGGKSIFDVSSFKEHGITLSFLEPSLPVYSQRRKTFESGLSIIDVMMWNPLEEISHGLVTQRVP